MVEKHKNYNLVHYCIGCNIIGLPEYVTHFVDTRKNPSPKISKKSSVPIIGFKQLRNWFKHEHNH